MPETGAAKKIFKWNPLTMKPRGRHKHRWEDNIIQDLGQMKIKNLITCGRSSLRRPKLPIKGG